MFHIATQHALKPFGEANAENFAGRGPYTGADAAGISFGVSQRFEIGGKRSARRAAAGKGFEIANSEIAFSKALRELAIAKKNLALLFSPGI